jgi:glyoxylate utilization-related uncharacterized protein
MYSFLQTGTLAKIIDEHGRDHEIELSTVDFYIAQQKYTVKVEGLENYFKEYLPNTVHCYIAPAGAASFPFHRDPYDVEIYCIEGIKTMIIEGKKVTISKGESILIPANVLHRATNEYDSVMLSIGYENAAR